jgi:PEP-CTERM motif
MFVMSRVSLIGTLAVLCCFPVVVQAEVILTGGNELIGAQGGLNEFGNLSGQLFTFNSSGFPSAGSASPVATAASASLNFLYTQIGDVATFTQAISQSQGGVPFGQAEHRFTIEFTAVNDLAFTFTSNYNGLGTAGNPQYYVGLLDATTLGNVFFDNSQDPLDLNPVENHAGFLIAGHTYSLNGASRLWAGEQGTGVPASATGTYVFRTSPIASPVPEPGSLVLLGTGAFGLILFRAGRRVAKR